MAEAAKVAARQLPAFKLGKKQVFLPNHVITFVRKNNLPPNEAQFKVPLRFTKFDLRDYLWNLYNVETVKVRSFVKERAIQMRPGTRETYRPQSDKYMIVQLAKPFQWPELPENLEAWNNELWSKRQEEMDKNAEDQARRGKFQLPMKSRQPLTKQREGLASLANDMLAGKIKWSNDVELDPKWDSLLKKQATKEGVDEAAVTGEAKSQVPPESR